MSKFLGPDELVNKEKFRKWSFAYDLTFVLMVIVIILFGSLAYVGYQLFNSMGLFQ